jgi:fatty-acyl-CoA synthase
MSPRTAGPDDFYLPRTLDEVLEVVRDRPALVSDGGRTIDYSTLRRSAAVLAGGLHDLGVRRGDHVAIWMNNRIEWLESWFAVARLGAILVPLNTRFTAIEARYIVEQSDTCWLIFDDTGKLSAEDFRQVTSKGTRLREVIALNSRSDAGIPFERLRSAAPRESDEEPGSVGIIQYTSGSTAFPKGAMLRNEAMIRNAWNLGEAWLVTDADRILCANPLFHNGGSVFSFLIAATHGAYVRLLDGWSVERAWEMIESERITVFPAIDTMVRDLVASPRRGTSLRLVSTAAARSLYEAVIERLGADVSNVFGLTEASPNVCVGDLRDPLETRLATTGRPQPGLEVEIRDPITRRPLSAGEEGAIVVRGWSVMVGYYNKPEETAAAIDPEGFLWTGDRGRLTPDGYLEFRGRTKQMIKSGGENVSIEEVENVLREHPSVADALVVPVPDARFGEVGYAFVRRRPGCELSIGQLSAHSRQRLAGFKVPKRFELVDDLPRTGSGKVDRVKMTALAVSVVEVPR